MGWGPALEKCRRGALPPLASPSLGEGGRPPLLPRLWLCKPAGHSFPGLTFN